MLRSPQRHGAPKTVAVIGCGPSGMFFLHALATRRRELERSGDVEGLASLPLVTCFEAAESPGGIWRSHPEGNEVNMYEGLWSNVPKELIEFADYTFEEHFDGQKVPTYLPRSDLLEYMLRRTTSVDNDLYDTPSWFYFDEGGRQQQRRQRIVKFNTSVRRVVYNAITRKFEVEWSPNVPTSHGMKSDLEGDSSNGSCEEDETGTKLNVTKEQFDFCIWAAGKHGMPRIPRPLLRLLRSGGSSHHDSSDEDEVDKPVPFRGTILHSSHMSNFDSAVRGKRVVLIGDSGSAEGIALRALKHDVEMVYMLSRSGYGDCVDTGSWPGDVNPETGKVEPKVKVLIAMPYRVVQNGTGLKCSEMVWNDEEEEYEIDDETAPIVLEKIDTVIFCTGYVPNQDCLSPDLQFQRVDDEELYWTVPDDFKMRPNALTPEFGDIEPRQELDLSGTIVPGICYNALVSNPRMMFLMDLTSEYPLMELDVGAWQCLAYITGDAAVPSKEEMERLIQEQMEEEMHVVYLRWCTDMNYYDEVNDLPYSHWTENWNDPRERELLAQYCQHIVRALARKMKNARYPVDFGTFDSLNELGEKYLRNLIHNFHARYGLNSGAAGAEWRTFRDVDPTLFCSIFTDEFAAPLPGRWLDLDKDGELTVFCKPILSNRKKCLPSECGDHHEERARRESFSDGKSVHGVCGPSVAVIGCGPSGMFFLHALATRRCKLEETNDAEALAALPRVTCFEAAGCPGGVWRSLPEQETEEHTPNMYEALWSNTPWPLFEFSDYTFKEHFGGQEVPAYLPRADILEYIMKRTQTVDPNLFHAGHDVNDFDTNSYDFADEKKAHENGVTCSMNDGRNTSRCPSVKFNTTVQRVNYNSATRKFELFYAPSTRRNAALGEENVTMEQFDFCIWAAGQHGKPCIPRPLLRLLRRGGNAAFYDGSSDEEEEGESVPFKGSILHSSHMSKFDSAVCGKRIVLIGDGGSAEDLALQAVKKNAEMVYILSRSGYGECAYTGSWPGSTHPETGKVEPKVEVHVALPYCVVQNGTGLKCSAMFWNEDEGLFETDSDETPIILEKIDTVIFCTGYVPNQGCLSPELRFQRVPGDNGCLTAPANFKMRPNALTPEIGEIDPSNELNVSGNVIPGVYRNVLISNPRMMYLTDFGSEYPLLELDVAAWLCLAYTTGDASIPSKEDMERLVQEETVEEMHIPFLRWCMDMNYFDALNDLPDNHWSDDWQDPRAKELIEQYVRYFTGVIARNMKSARYPVDFGTYGVLNELGEKFVEIEMNNISARHGLDPKSIDATWKTFRDADPGHFCSIYTGQSAGPLPGRWLDLDKDGKLASFSTNNCNKRN